MKRSYRKKVTPSVVNNLKRSIPVLLVVLLFGAVLLRVMTMNPEPRALARVGQVYDIGAAEPLGIDYSRNIALGSPLVFGGSSTPVLGHVDSWNLLKDTGVTMMRNDFHMQNNLPTNITLNDYINNVNDVQNPNTWNQSNINYTGGTFRYSKDRGMKVIGIVDYSPAWLTHSNTTIGVPRNWDVFEDIVKKNYRLYRPYMDMIEIWNEPDINWFLNLSGSGLTRKEAYLQIFQHAVTAIKSVDAEIADGREIPILAPAAASPKNIDIIDHLLSNPISEHVDGVSVHSYDTEEPSWRYYLDVMKKYGKGNLPIYITEWNKTSQYIRNSAYVSGVEAIPFTGKKLLQFMKSGIAGANYFSTTRFDPNSSNMYVNSFGFFTWSNYVSTLLPHGKTWQLLSKSLALGAGTSTVHRVFQPAKIEAMGFTNAGSEPGVAMVNSTSEDLNVRVSMQNLKIPKSSVGKVYVASGINDAKVPYCTEDTSVDVSNPSFFVTVPAKSVVGVVFTKPKLVFVNTLLRILGVSTSVEDCLVGF